MSRIGKKPIPVPAGVDVAIEGNTITVKGPLGELTYTYPVVITVAQEGDEIIVTRPNDERQNRAYHGLVRSLINNMVEGVSKGFSKRLELVGVGYRAALKGGKLEMQLGYSHPVIVEAPEGITLEVPDQTHIVVKGCDKQLVGETAAVIRKWRKPEPYKGKGIRYEGEYVRRKLGKAAKGDK
ncbi:BL10 [Slackia heliotrinireducens]|uniref:Large ribosomal subunit protein uL6 n=1 Tax=Slackia heliotrinireducens (strain ATCC 29202 / DSM 20476 / NCTC 11029 / RHS 1) TaxID=471855 RepID=C7N1Q0_SLAHD|nr:50S ribosomal protein L6 [Slackia heliotrinireducens]ACV23341.1 LSU ribosomal protein L6P [Slackia heliotrinireducens DSM 20476]VEH02571.1 BL10 [Slackia heliotrinireducens]